MPKKIFELANELEIGSLDLVEKLRANGFNVRNHMSVLSDDELQKVQQIFAASEVQDDGKAKKKVVRKKSATPSTTTKKKIVSKKPKEEEKEENPRKIVTVKRKIVQHDSSTSQDIEKKQEEELVLKSNQLEDFASENLDDSYTELDEESKTEVFEEVEEDEESSDLKRFEVVKYPDPVVEEVVEDKNTEPQNVEVKSAPIEEEQKVNPPKQEERPRGLRVVYRPPVEEKKVEKEVAPKTEREERANEHHIKGKKHHPHKKEVFEEKMHSFTPVYIPPKKEVEDKDQSKVKVIKRTKESIEKAQKEKKLRPDINDAVYNPDLNDSKDKKKTTVPPVAGAVAPKVTKGKVKDVTQLRADEELKSYALGIVGKIIYTPQGKKKNYSGPTKSTKITEVKDAKRVIKIHKGCEAKDLANKLSIKFEDLRDQALDVSILLREDDYLDVGLLEMICELYSYRVEDISFDESKALSDGKEVTKDASKNNGDFPLRSPIVTVMGHVDHGKTTLLDFIRKAKVAEGEAGGITQHVAAYTVEKNGKEITFIDTPGHAAFGSIRERGANVTDIVVLVVAADDGVMPQTKESIRFCQTAGVPIIVAVNKMDKEGVNPDRVKQALMEFSLTPEEWGGDTQYVNVSGLKGLGIEELLESINLQSEIMDIRANDKCLAEGVVLESKIETGRGPLVTILVQKGTLKKGDSVVAGESFGRARSIMDTTGKLVNEVKPGKPALIIGFDTPPSPGEMLNVVKTEREAKKIVENRIAERKELESVPKQKMSLEDFFGAEAPTGDEKKVLKLVVRADVVGSYEAVKGALSTLGNEEVSVELIGGGVGAITESDVILADSAKGYVVGFNVALSTNGRKMAESKGVDVKSYRIIYELIQDVKNALEGLLVPETVEKYIGRAEVRDIFNIPKIGVIAGSAVIDGKIERGCNIRLLRDGKIIHDGKLASLKRFKDDVKEVKNGYECGISLEGFDSINVSDIFEAYTLEEKKRTLNVQEGML